MRENAYQHYLIGMIQETFPGAVVLKNDTQYQQGIPDLLVLFRERWAMLEVKRSESAPTQPNQGFFIELFGDMSYGAFIYPENEEAVLNDLQQLFAS